MPGSIPATSQLDWLISTTAIIVLSWSRATRDLLKSFGWGIGALHRFTQRRWCHLLAACPIASLGTVVLGLRYGQTEEGARVGAKVRNGLAAGGNLIRTPGPT